MQHQRSQKRWRPCCSRCLPSPRRRLLQYYVRRMPPVEEHRRPGPATRERCQVAHLVHWPRSTWWAYCSAPDEQEEHPAPYLGQDLQEVEHLVLCRAHGWSQASPDLRR